MTTLLGSPEAAHAAGSIPATLRDGYELHLAALRHGLDVALYPRQVLIASGGGGPELAFVHGVPQTSTLAAVTYAQDKAMRRELLARAGLPIPEGATFAIGRDRALAGEFAARIGYPVVVKPAVGDSLTEVFAGIRDQRQLDAAIDYLRTPEAERPAFTRAAYGLTLLLEPDEEDGRQVSPASYRFLLERHVPGRYIRCLVLGGELVSVLRLDGLTSDRREAAGEDLTGQVDEGLRELAIRAVRTIPGLALAAVDLVVVDGGPAPAGQPVSIVELSERPWLATQARIDEALGHRIGEAILRHHATELGLTLPPPREQVRVEFQAEGAADAGALATAIAGAAAGCGLAADVQVADQVEGILEGTLSGAPAPITLIFESLLSGGFHGQRAMLVEAHQRKAAG